MFNIEEKHGLAAKLSDKNFTNRKNPSDVLKALCNDRKQYAEGYQDAKEEFGKYATWHSCEDCLPSIGEQVLVQTINDTIHLMFYKGEPKCWGENINLDICPSLVKYWAPLLPIKED